MEKHLTSVGNSVAVVIDRALCRMFDLRRGSSVRISTDGQRIVIEPMGIHKAAPTKAEPPEFTIVQIIETLIAYDVREDVIRTLHPGIVGPRPHAKLLAWADSVKADSSEADQRYARRFRAYFEKLRERATVAAAVEAALKSG